MGLFVGVDMVPCFPCFVCLHYGEGKSEEFSLWFGKRILYAGDAEDLTMSCMLGDLLHFGGLLLADIVEFLNELTR